MGIVSKAELQQALEVQSRTSAFVGQILVDLGFVDAAVIGPLLAVDFQVRYVDLRETRPDPEAVRLVPEELVRSVQAIPLRASGQTLHVAMVDPLDVSAIDRLHMATNLRIIPHLSMSAELLRALNDHFDATFRTTAALQELEHEPTAVDREKISRAELAAASEAPVVRLVDSIIEGALASRASDIHFEPQEKHLRVRYRIDGTLLDQAEIPRSQMPAMLARLKVLCLMDITENRRPQDGRMRYDNHGRPFDVRVSSVPTVFGEKLVLRILDKTSVLVPLSKLGFLPDQHKRFESLIRSPYGMVIVVGPTGSGKSTTLYSALNLLNDHTRNIMTLEDPVEYNVAGLNQVQVNHRIGLTFASGLRTFVRQDPDVILVGEIRDSETAEMAVQASLTGHLMLSTLHTNSAIGSIARLMNLGLDPFLISQSLAGVVSQRLVAAVCQKCKYDYHPPVELLEALHICPQQAAEIRFKKGRGCRQCHGRGYHGRFGVFEVLAMDEELRRLIMRRASEEELQAVAEREGMTTLAACALAAVRSGATSPEEMGRVVHTKGG